ASPEVSGPVKGKLQVSGALSRLGATGQLDLSRVTVSQERSQCPPPTRRQLTFNDVRVPVLLRPAAFESAPLSAKLGKGSVALTFTAGLTEPSPLLNLTHITIEGVELRPVLQGYLCQGFAVSGPLDLGGELSMRAADVWRSMNGTGRLKIGKGRVVGEGALKLVRDVLEAGTVVDQALRGKFSGSSKVALDFDSITGSYRITAGVLRTDDLLYQGKDLKVAVAGTYALVDGRTDMNVVATQGSNQLRAQVTGSGGSLRVIPTGVKVKEPEQIRKLLDRLLR
ncbi:MAG: AsmA-like C-terminal region-containing protein, partial [Candidatus Rokubacteria bacterium]|nr:AsmA-like C-terminal region-containing protein [Candidatus Rokubacteria bacterium]